MFPQTRYTLGYLGQVDEGDDVISDEDILQDAINPADKARLQCQYAGGTWQGGRCVMPPPPPRDEDLLEDYLDDLTDEQHAELACAYAQGSWDAERQVCTPKGQFPIPPEDVDELRCLYQEGTWDPVTRLCTPKGGAPPGPYRPPEPGPVRGASTWAWVLGGVGLAGLGYMLWNAG